MPKDRLPREEHGKDAEGVRERAEDQRQDAEQDRRLTEDPPHFRRGSP